LLFSKPIYFFINHWPSRRGGEEESRAKRIAAAKTARFSIDTILKADPKANIVLMGDFNDSPVDKSIVEFLGASDSPEAKDLVLFNAMAPLAKAGDGSHSYKNEWNMLDQIILSKNLLSPKSKLKYEPNSAAVYRPIWMHDKYSKHQGAPYRTYSGPKFIGGYSDHFPVFVKLRM
jgi:endonuclease/exonuclease/phosphatase family metal-dependent hydrolase